MSLSRRKHGRATGPLTLSTTLSGHAAGIRQPGEPLKPLVCTAKIDPTNTSDNVAVLIADSINIDRSLGVCGLVAIRPSEENPILCEQYLEGLPGLQRYQSAGQNKGLSPFSFGVVPAPVSCQDLARTAGTSSRLLQDVIRQFRIRTSDAVEDVVERNFGFVGLARLTRIDLLFRRPYSVLVNQDRYRVFPGGTNSFRTTHNNTRLRE